MTDREKCSNCIYFHRLKHNHSSVGFVESHACDVLLHIDDGGEGWIQEVHPDGMCEMFTERINNEKKEV